uniref:Uncharacterized protein n=1 Tax=Oryza glaberrima TaxID=4538 RepID=I1PKL9_ORYGL
IKVKLITPIQKKVVCYFTSLLINWILSWKKYTEDRLHRYASAPTTPEPRSGDTAASAQLWLDGTFFLHLPSGSVSLLRLCSLRFAELVVSLLGSTAVGRALAGHPDPFRVVHRSELAERRSSGSALTRSSPS